MRNVVVVLAALAVPASIHAQTPGTPAIPPARVETGLRPAHKALLVSGVILASMVLDNAVHEEMQEWRNPTSNSLAGVGNNFGTGKLVFPTLLAGWVAGTALGSSGLQRASGHALVAASVAGVTVTALKFAFGRQRPSSGFDADHYDLFQPGDASFPSGHTAIAFSVATSLSRDIKGRWDDVALYSAASLTGFARMNDNKHWLSDVVAGAAVGIVSGRWATRGNRQVSAGPSGVVVNLRF